MLKFIPNLFTLGNLFCGSLAVIFIFEDKMYLVPLLIAISAFLDFFDGFIARAVNASGPLGKELDSLADMVSFGLVPGLIMYDLSKEAQIAEFGMENYYSWGPYLALIITLASCYRLANFNISTDQSDEFIGVPTPACTLFFLSYPILKYFAPESELYTILMTPSIMGVLILFMTYMLNAKTKLIAMKFKGFGWNRDNAFRYTLIGGAILLFVIFKWSAMPLAILFYIGLSMVKNLMTKSSLS